MPKRPFEPFLLDLLPAVLTDSSEDLGEMLQAKAVRARVIVFLENCIAQTCKNSFGLTFTSLNGAYPALHQKLKNSRWASKQPASLLAFGKAISSILRDWPDISGSGYGSDPGVPIELVSVTMPKLLLSALRYAKRIKDTELAGKLQTVILSWTEVFGAK